MITRFVLATAMAVSTVAAPAVAADVKPMTFKSEPCTTDGLCAQVYKYVPLDAVVSLQIKTPASGTAVVTATGAMQCVNSSVGNYDKRVVDLSGQIIKKGETPVSSGANVTRFAMRMPERTTSQEQSVAINLANTRVVNVRQGRTIFEYWLVKNRVDEETYCNIYDLNLTALFIP